MFPALPVPSAKLTLVFASHLFEPFIVSESEVLNGQIFQSQLQTRMADCFLSMNGEDKTLSFSLHNFLVYLHWKSEVLSSVE